MERMFSSATLESTSTILSWIGRSSACHTCPLTTPKTGNVSMATSSLTRALERTAMRFQRIRNRTATTSTRHFPKYSYKSSRAETQNEYWRLTAKSKLVSRKRTVNRNRLVQNMIRVQTKTSWINRKHKNSQDSRMRIIMK